MMVLSTQLLWVGGLLVALAANAATQEATAVKIPPAAPKATHFVVQVVQSLQNGADSRICAGSLVSLKHAVTTADCVSEEKPSDIRVYTGNDVLWRYGVNGTLHNVTACRRHPKYAMRRIPGNVAYDYDVAVVRLAQPVSVGNMVATIGLPAVSPAGPKAGTTFTLAGWGVYDWGEEDEDTKIYYHLTTHTVKVLDKAQCKARLTADITANEFCLENAPPVGEAGSALYSSNNVLRGFVSWGGAVATDLSNSEIQSFVRDMMRTL